MSRLAPLSLGLALTLACHRAGDGGHGAADADLQTCDAVVYPPQQLRLLSRRELSATVSELLGGEAAGPARFQLDGSDGAWRSVVVAGDWNGWAATAEAGGLAMDYDASADAWTAELALDPGTYAYKFVIDGGTWVADPGNSETEDDGYGGANSVLRVSGGLDLGELAAGLPAETRPDGFPFDNSAEGGLVSTAWLSAALDAFEVAAEAAVADPDALLGCDASDAACAEAWARSFGRRAWRRPLDDDEAARLLALLDGGDTVEDGLSRVIQATLGSPNFLYRAEVGAPLAGGLYRLDAYETASALSFFLWGRGPDDTLLDAAAAGELDTADGLQAQARRLLADDRAREALGAFAAQWLGVESVLTDDKNATVYPDFDADLAAEMLDEVEALVPAVIFDRSGAFPELMTGRALMPGPRLAAIYGVSPDSGGVAIAPDGQRAGVLGLAAVLTATAHSDQTSPIRRGVFVRERLLCQDLPPPPANAGGVPDVDPDATTRERYAQHTADPSCAACHQYIDDVGFGFERYDAIGAWREVENGVEIDPSGDMNDLEGLGAGTDAPYSSLPALGQILADSDAAASCFAVQLNRFALGWAPDGDEACAVAEPVAAFAAADYDIQTLLLSLVTSPAFRLRQEAP